MSVLVDSTSVVDVVVDIDLLMIVCMGTSCMKLVLAAVVLVAVLVVVLVVVLVAVVAVVLVVVVVVVAVVLVAVVVLVVVDSSINHPNCYSQSHVDHHRYSQIIVV